MTCTAFPSYNMLYTLNFKNVLSQAVHYNALSLNNLFILTSLCSSFVVFLIQVLKFLRSSILQLLSLHLLLIDVQLLFLYLDIIKLCLSNLQSNSPPRSPQQKSHF